MYAPICKFPCQRTNDDVHDIIVDLHCANSARFDDVTRVRRLLADGI